MGKFNVDIAEKVAEFRSLIRKISTKEILFKILLRSRGLEFEGYRDFSLDEDASAIDWKASNRANKLLAKGYVEERDINVMFLVDVSDNMIFGSQEKLKCEFCAELVCALSDILINSGDKIGFILFSNEIIKINYPKGGKKQFDILIYEILNTDNYGGNYNSLDIFKKTNELLNSSIDLIILISDFLNINKEVDKKLKELRSLSEVIAISIKDPLDMTLPDINKEIFIENPRTGGKILMNPRVAKRTYEKNSLKQRQLTKNLFKNSDIDFLEISTEKDFYPDVANFLIQRSNQGGF